MFTITKDFRFEAAHSLPHLPSDHKCHRLHGHSYRITVECSGETDSRGFVIDYAEISDAVKPLIERLDHYNLDEIIPSRTTAENLAVWIFNQLMHSLPGLSGIIVYETATTSVIYRPNEK
jgi:6-pyruvoyltetrahydropterin/6-carboxytetrahydropterin synthase